jgi:tight adherence protein B
MRDSGLITLLLVLSCLSLLGLGISGAMVSKAQKQRKRRDERLGMVRDPRGRAQTIQLSAITRVDDGKGRSVTAICASIFGFSLERAEFYPVAWWLILLAALLIAKLVQVVLADFAGDLSTVALPAVWIFVSRSIFAWFEQRRKQRLVTQLPEMLDQVVRAVRVGLPAIEAIRSAVRESADPTRAEFLRLVDEVAVGTPLNDAAMALARRCNLPEYNFLATALSLQSQTGGALTETLSNLADVVRRRIAIAERGKALVSEGKMTAVVLAALPFITGTALWFLNPSYINTLFADPTGHKLLGAGAVLLTLGLLTIRMMFQKALSVT